MSSSPFAPMVAARAFAQCTSMNYNYLNETIGESSSVDEVNDTLPLDGEAKKKEFFHNAMCCQHRFLSEIEKTS